MMTEARRATAALAALVTLAAAAGVLLPSYLPYLLEPHLRTIAWYCRLLSIAPADHPESERWQPSTAFHERFARRDNG